MLLNGNRFGEEHRSGALGRDPACPRRAAPVLRAQGEARAPRHGSVRIETTLRPYARTSSPATDKAARTSRAAADGQEPGPPVGLLPVGPPAHQLPFHTTSLVAYAARKEEVITLRDRCF